MLKEMNRLWKLADRRTGMNILICDDELLAAEKIADLVSHFAAQRHLAVSVVKFTDVEKCMESSLERCDIAFLDIDMKPYNGIDLARVLHDANPNAIILAEHYGNPEGWLKGDEWDTVMNYDAFMEPLTWFLTGMEKHSDEYREDLLGNLSLIHI